MTARTLLALTGAIATLGIAACGGDDNGGALSTEEYDERTEAALQSIVDLDELSEPLANPGSVEEYVDGVRAIEAEISSVVDELEAIEPPSEIASLHDELIELVAGYGAAFPPVADAAEAEDQKELQKQAQKLQESAVEFQQTATDLDARFQEEGIDLANLT